MLEKMSDFFETRLDGYDEHMMTNIESANEFYPFTAKQLPTSESCQILDLGCGTGLELQEYYMFNPTARVTGIDLSQGMLSELKRKFVGKEITLIHGSYFDVPLGKNVFDAAVSVESLHHFEKEGKVAIYARLHTALKNNGYFILNTSHLIHPPLSFPEQPSRSMYVRHLHRISYGSLILPVNLHAHPHSCNPQDMSSSYRHLQNQQLPDNLVNPLKVTNHQV